jgi:hypothetical protein
MSPIDPKPVDRRETEEKEPPHLSKAKRAGEVYVARAGKGRGIIGEMDESRIVSK